MKKIPQINCSIPTQIQTITGYCQGDQRCNLTTLTGITLHLQTLQMFSAGMHMEEESQKEMTKL